MLPGYLVSTNIISTITTAVDTILSMYVLLQVPLYGSFHNAFRSVRTVLVDKIDVSQGLIDVLLHEGVLAESHVSDIMASTLCSRPLHRLFANAI